jgi:hypothetical protein
MFVERSLWREKPLPYKIGGDAGNAELPAGIGDRQA